MKHTTVQANGASFHVVPSGDGAPLLLLHRWPEFWLTWEPVMARLANRYRLIAPDLRGFGDSDKPQGPYGAPDHAADVVALLDPRLDPGIGPRFTSGSPQLSEREPRTARLRGSTVPPQTGDSWTRSS